MNIPIAVAVQVTKPRRHITSTLASVALALAATLSLVASPATAAPGCTVAQGQALIEEGRYSHAIRAFTCVIGAAPTEVEGYRGRIEAQLLLGRYSDALRDYTRVTALVLPVHPDAMATIYDGYAARLSADPADVVALTGASFARWYDFDYPQAVQVLNRLLEVAPNDRYGTLFRGSSRVLQGGPMGTGLADLERAIELAPESPDVHYIVADAYTYGLPDPQRAFAEATLALEGGLDTPRVHAILASAYNAFGDVEAAAEHIARHLDLVTTELVPTDTLPSGETLALDLVPGRSYQIPIAAAAGEVISITASSHDYWDSIAVLLAPDGSPAVGSDDDSGYHAAIDWVATATGTYLLQATFFESVNFGELVVSRD